MSNGHALLSPSSAHRWFSCPGSVALEQTQPDSSSSFADEGTAAHFLAAMALTENKNAIDYAEKTIVVHADGEFFYTYAHKESDYKNYRLVKVDSEMVENVQSYLDLVRSFPGDLYVEQKYLIDHITGEEEAKGTSDAVIINGDQLTIIDLKYGKGVQVYAEENPQLALYAAGAIEHWSFCTEFEHIQLIICQPRLNHTDIWTTDKNWMATFTTIAQDAAKRCVNDPNGIDLNPGEKQCWFCKAKGICPALASHVLNTVAGDFVDLSQPLAPQLSPTTVEIKDLGGLANLMRQLDLIENWCKAIRAQTERELLAGHHVPGYKLVEGGKGARAWGDKEQVETLMKQMRIKTDIMYAQILISPTTAEKRFKEGKIGPRQWPKLQEQISQATGKPCVVSATDKRPALIMQAAVADIDDLTPAEPDDLV